MDYFKIEHIFFRFLDYEVSHLEFWSILSGYIAVYLAARNNKLTWPVAILNAILLFGLFFQFQLYADMFLQIYFFCIAIYGWFNWKGQRSTQIKILGLRQKIFLLVCMALLWPSLAELVANLHLFFPTFFTQPAAYAYADSLIMLLSIVAQFLLTKRIMENWYLWIAVNLLGIAVYGLKGMLLLSIQYVVFLVLAIIGTIEWRKALANKY